MFSDKLRFLRLQKGLTQEQLAAALGTAKSTVSMYENGNRTPDFEMLGTVSELFGVSLDYLLGNGSKSSPAEQTARAVTFPVMGKITAGYNGIAAEECGDETVDIPESCLRGRPASDYFVLSVVGNSMYPLYQEGDRALILRQPTVRSGEVAAVLYDGDHATLKKVEYVPGENRMKLIPLNPEYMPKTISGADLENCRILGVPRLLIRELPD